MKELNLLPKESLEKTGAIDHADWNYNRSVLGWIQRQRFYLILSLFNGRKFQRILEIGYGSGVFYPELAERSGELYGIDIHPCQRKVASILAQHKVRANLYSGTAENMPFETDYFDAIVAVSTLEFIPDLRMACREIRRSLSPRGSFFVVTPVESAITDLGLRLLTGTKAKDYYEHHRRWVIPILREHFAIVKHQTFPRFGSSTFCLYNAFELSKP